MFCSNCGQKLDDNAVTCPNCGAETGVSPAVGAEKPAEQAGEPRQQQAQPGTERPQGQQGFEQQQAYQPYQAQQYQPPRESESNGYAIAGLICAFFIPILGLIFSCMGLNRSKKMNGEGKGVSIAGIVISVLAIVLIVVVVIIYVAVIVAAFNAAGQGVADKLSDSNTYAAISAMMSSII